ncbi:MAG: 4Fe-4S binding protein [Elusimicrobia bacterium]|nr:4Fe-4S binding protein [Elusimicrobiota bacterium]MBU2614993.1 4Fe-4S binding protein [Elusimicrobiota bacterium]
MKLNYLKNVTTLKLNAQKCNGCGKCIEVCPHEVFEIKNKKSFIKEKDACMECGACAKNCPEGALEVNAGVGCAAAIIAGALTGSATPCGPSCCSGKSK